MPDLTTPDGVRLHVEDEGQGPPIVLVHGWCGSTRTWDRLVPHLRDERRVVRYDARGHGGSQGKDETFDFEHFAADLEFVMGSLALEHAVAIGWSMGAGVIHHHLGRNGPGRLVGVGVIDYPVKLQEKNDVADKVCHQLNKRRDDFLDGFFTRMLLTDDDTEAHELLVHEARRVTRRAACASYRAMGMAPEPEEETFGIPALLVFPEQGWFTEALADWRARFPEHEAPGFPNSRHAPPLEEPETLAETILEFTEPTGRVNVSNV